MFIILSKNIFHKVSITLKQVYKKKIATDFIFILLKFKQN